MINKAFSAVLTCAVYFISNTGEAAEIKILCASGMREVVSELQPQLVRLVGQQVSISFGEAGDLRKRIQGGEIADVTVLPRIVLDQVMADGNIVPGTIIDVAQSSIGIGVRKNGPKLDISSADKFKQALLAAKAIVVGDPASGGVAAVHVADVFRRLGIMVQLTPKLKPNSRPAQRGVRRQGRSRYRGSALERNQNRSRIEFIPFPPEFGRTFTFSAALGSNAKDPNAAKAILRFLAGPEAVAVIEAKGMDQLHPSRDGNVRFGSKADMCSAIGDVRFVPKADISEQAYSITSSARPINVFGTLRPSALAVLRLITNSYFVGA